MGNHSKDPPYNVLFHNRHYFVMVLNSWKTPKFQIWNCQNGSPTATTLYELQGERAHDFSREWANSRTNALRIELLRYTLDTNRAVTKAKKALGM